MRLKGVSWKRLALANMMVAARTLCGCSADVAEEPSDLGTSQLAHVVVVQDDSGPWPSESEVEGPGLGRIWEEGTGLGIAGRPFHVGIGERTVWEQCPLCS